MSTTIDAGLAFAIPLAEKKFGFGQLIAWQNPIFYMMAYDVQSESPEIAARDLQKAATLFMGNFFDVLIRNDRWKSIGIIPIPKVAFPCFKVKIGDRFFTESWDRLHSREATTSEMAILPFRTNYAPIILENALKAHFKLIPWERTFDPLKTENVAALEKMF